MGEDLLPVGAQSCPPEGFWTSYSLILQLDFHFWEEVSQPCALCPLIPSDGHHTVSSEFGLV